MADGTGMQVSHLGRDIFGDIFTVLEDAVAALTADPGDADYDANEAALSAAMVEVDEGINRLGKAQPSWAPTCSSLMR